MKRFSLPFLLAAGIVTAAYLDSDPIVIESAESTNLDGDHVINKISWKREGNKDIWSMKQSHHGVDSLEWDNLQIVVDREARSAEFFQFDANGKPTAYRVSCFLCHSNGPRAIRHFADGTQVTLNVWDKLRLFTWNMKIKSYGPLPTVDAVYGRPVRWPQPAANEVLNVNTCVKCHNSESHFGRGPLTKQNFLAIRFMLEQKHMPPWPFELPADEHQAILEFVN